MQYTPNEVKKVQAEHIKNRIKLGVIVKGHSKGDDWATIQSQIIAQAAYSSADVAVADSGDDVTITFNPKSDVDPSNTALQSEDISFLALDTDANKVLHCADMKDRLVTNETNDRVSWPAIVHTIKETVSV